MIVRNSIREGFKNMPAKTQDEIHAAVEKATADTTAAMEAAIDKFELPWSVNNYNVKSMFDPQTTMRKLGYWSRYIFRDLMRTELISMNLKEAPSDLFMRLIKERAEAANMDWDLNKFLEGWRTFG